MSVDDGQALQHVLRLARASVNAHHVELALGEGGFFRVSATTPDSLGPIEASTLFFATPQAGPVAGVDELADSPYGSFASIPITGPSAEPGWLVAVHCDPDALDEDSLDPLSSAATLIEQHLDRGVEKVRLDQISDVLRSNQTTLRTTQERLEVSNRELEQFAYVAAHELLSPMRSVVVYADLLHSEFEGMGAEQIRSCTSEIRGGVELMDRQLHYLLELSSTQDEAADPVSVDLSDVVQEAVKTLEPQLQEANATVKFGDLPVVEARPVLLQSVFANLISNAVKYRKPGVDPEIRIDAEQDSNATRIFVADNGLGIDETNQSRVFQLFERASTSTPGSGIGLGLSRRIVEAFGGSINYGSGKTGGSIFTITFPRTFPPATTAS